MDLIATTASIGAVPATEAVNIGYGASLTEDAAAFEASMASARDRVPETNSVSDIAKAAFEPLDYINKEAQALSDYAKNAVASGNELTPGEIVNLTVQSQKFMFHSQLTANVANRSADGIQQLFRQQG